MVNGSHTALEERPNPPTRTVKQHDLGVKLNQHRLTWFVLDLTLFEQYLGHITAGNYPNHVTWMSYLVPSWQQKRGGGWRGLCVPHTTLPLKPELKPTTFGLTDALARESGPKGRGGRTQARTLEVSLLIIRDTEYKLSPFEVMPWCTFDLLPIVWHGTDCQQLLM